MGEREPPPTRVTTCIEYFKSLHKGCDKPAAMTALEEDGTKSNVGLIESAKITLFPAVNAAIQDAQGRVLLTRRSNKVREPGLWCLPGGHFDPGETWAEASAREVREEVGLVVSQPRLLGIYSDPICNVVPHPRAPGGLGQFVAAVFLYTVYEGQVTPNDEVSEFGWFSPGQYPEPLLASHRVRLADWEKFSGEAYFR
jgi:ADP-ribose pyrophosphatase YjhB (NUDIX family)